MMKFFLILLCLSFYSFSCEIETYSSILKFKKVLNNSIIKKSNCKGHINKNFISIISSMEGKIPAKAIQRHLNNVKIKPKKIEVSSIKNFLHRSYDEQDYRISAINTISSASSLNLESLNSLQLNCKKCLESGQKTIKLFNKNQIIWISATFIKAKEVIVLKEDFRKYGNSLTQNDIEIKKVFTDTNQNLFYDIKNINYYKISKFIPKGHILKTYDLVPKNLITPGKPVDLVIESKSLSLKTKMISNASSQIGKIVELINPKTKRKILATVTGTNKAILKL